MEKHNCPRIECLERLVRIEQMLDHVRARVDDHETRLRDAERIIYKAAIACGFASMVGGAVVSFIARAVGT